MKHYVSKASIEKQIDRLRKEISEYEKKYMKSKFTNFYVKLSLNLLFLEFMQVCK